MKMKNSIKFLMFGLILSVSLLASFDFAKADAACNGKPSGTQCSLGDSHTIERGVCDASGNCMIGTTKITTPDGPGSAGQITDNIVPGSIAPGEESQFIKCGRAGQRMCTLCDLILGLNDVIRFIMRVSIGIGILAFTAAGVMYIVSAGDPGLKGTANTTMKNAVIGFVVILASWLIVNTVILSLGSKTDAQGNATFGMKITGWGKFECAANPNR